MDFYSGTMVIGWDCKGAPNVLYLTLLRMESPEEALILRSVLRQCTERARMKLNPNHEFPSTRKEFLDRDPVPDVLGDGWKDIGLGLANGVLEFCENNFALPRQYLARADMIEASSEWPGSRIERHHYLSAALSVNFDEWYEFFRMVTPPPTPRPD